MALVDALLLILEEFTCEVMNEAAAQRKKDANSKTSNQIRENVVGRFLPLVLRSEGEATLISGARISTSGPLDTKHIGVTYI